MFNNEDLIKSHKERVNLIANLILLAFLMILARLWYLQVYKGELLLNYSLQNQLRREVVIAPRGMIFSRDNHLIVNNIPRFDAVITPQYFKNRQETILRLSKILEMPVDSIQKVLHKNAGQASYRPIIVKKNISRKEVAIIETENADLPGVSVETFISREYIDGEIGAHLLGYIAEISPLQLPKYRKRDKFDYKIGDFIGQSGIEEELDLFLRGMNGYEFVEVDATGRKKRHINTDNIFNGVVNSPSNPGLNVRLTIDRDLQVSAYQALEGKVGAAVAVDVKTGEVLAMVSRPGFRPELFNRGISSDEWAELSNNENNPMRDRSIQEHYSPGSTFKMIAAVAALEEGIIDEKTEVVCNGKFTLGRRTFHCWKKHGHGVVNVVKSLRESCDVFYYKIAMRLDIDILAKYAKKFGFSKKTGIELPREVPGLVPTKEWKKKRNGQEWMLGETLSCIIGQSYMLASPLQLTMAYSVIANGGKLLRPHVYKEIFQNSGKVHKQVNSEEIENIGLSERTLKIVRQGLFEVVNAPGGTAFWQKGQGIEMAGKTGTSQVVRLSAEKLFAKCEETEYRYRHHGVFVGYAPSDDPKIAVGVMVEHGCHGASAAAPVARDVITKYMQKYFPERYQYNLEAEKKRSKEARIIAKAVVVPVVPDVAPAEAEDEGETDKEESAPATPVLDKSAT